VKRSLSRKKDLSSRGSGGERGLGSTGEVRNGKGKGAERPGGGRIKTQGADRKKNGSNLTRGKKQNPKRKEGLGIGIGRTYEKNGKDRRRRQREKSREKKLKKKARGNRGLARGKLSWGKGNSRRRGKNPKKNLETAEISRNQHDKWEGMRVRALSQGRGRSLGKERN